MKLDKGLVKLFTPFVVSLLIIPSMVHAVDADNSNEWTQRVLIYGWFPSIEGTLNYDIPGSGGSVGADASNIVDKLQGVFMGTYEARKQKWSFKGDVIYLSLSNSEDQSISIPGGGNPTLGIQQDMKAWVVGLYGGYNVHQTERVTTDILAGVRYLSMDVDAKLDSTIPLPPALPNGLSESVTLWDGIVGVKGKAMLSDKWYVPYHFDIGTGNSDLTWQALVIDSTVGDR